MCITPTCVLSARAINQLFVENPVAEPGEDTLGRLNADYNIRKTTNSDPIIPFPAMGKWNPFFQGFTLAHLERGWRPL
jgi:hypothetical protein